MGSFASEVTVSQRTEFFNRFHRFGGNKTKLEKLLRDDEFMEAWVKRLDGVPELRLKHGVFSTTVDVLAAFKARCAAKGLDFGKFSWVGSEQAPEFDPNDAETVVVLDATLYTLQKTFDFAWAWTVDGQHNNSWRSDRMLSDAKKLRLLSDAEGDGPKFKPYTLRWVRIKLDTSVGKKPVDVRDPKFSPGCALLFMSAEHPARIRAMNFEKRFGFWLPGLQCKAPAERKWADVPFVQFDLDDRQVLLASRPADISDDELANPSFRG